MTLKERDILSNPMTVCIGAICENGKAIVVASDRMVTFGHPINVQTEPGIKKIIELTDTSVALISGSVADGEEIISNSKQEVLSLPKKNISDIAQVVRKRYSELKKFRVQDTILRPLLGTDFDGFQRLVAGSASSQVLQQILGLISQHNLQLDILIAGSDDTGCHLWLVTHPGQLICLDTLGYTSIGSGNIHANIRLSIGYQSKNLSITETLYNVYEAKREAEIAPGVGKGTDIALIKDSKTVFFDDSFLNLIEKSHKKKPMLEDSEIKIIKAGWEKYVTTVTK